MGRGRFSRSFYYPFAKGIWFSLILRPTFFPLEASKSTLLAAVAVCRALRSAGLPQAAIKWPNDILVDGRKLVGILTELSASMERIDYIVMGIGINTGIERIEFPEDFRDKTTSFLAEGIAVSRKQLLAAVLAELEKLYMVAETEGFDKILEDWKTLSCTIGNEVQVISEDKTFIGKAVDLDNNGCLLVDTGTKIERVIAGDVSIRPVKQ